LPTLGQLLAQMFLLQDVLEIPSISAGAWYVAIDLQLYALLVLFVHWRGRVAGTPLAQSHVPALVAIATIASIHVFSRDADLDAWAIYFLPAYGLGALVAWSRQSPAAIGWLLLTAGLLVADWLVDPRVRPLLALATAAALFVVPRRPWAGLRQPLRRLVTYGSDLSYSIFVCHFAVIVLASGLWMRFELEGLAWAIGFTLLAWAGSLLAGAGVHACIERAGSMKRRIVHE
jgi:peptidoglycan/LPS O-acetylase OafA/YrhL